MKSNTGRWGWGVALLALSCGFATLAKGAGEGESVEPTDLLSRRVPIVRLEDGVVLRNVRVVGIHRDRGSEPEVQLRVGAADRSYRLGQFTPIFRRVILAAEEERIQLGGTGTAAAATPAAEHRDESAESRVDRLSRYWTQRDLRAHLQRRVAGVYASEVTINSVEILQIRTRSRVEGTVAYACLASSSHPDSEVKVDRNHRPIVWITQRFSMEFEIGADWQSLKAKMLSLDGSQWEIE